MTMEQAFILPLPESQGYPEFDELYKNDFQSPECKLLYSSLEKLGAKSLSWETFFDLFNPTDPLLRVVTTKHGDNILHLAVSANLEKLPEELSLDKYLLYKRNNYGLTPIELSAFLKKGSFSPYLPEVQLAPFNRVSNVSIDENKYSPLLDRLLYTPNPVFENEKDLYKILKYLQKAKAKDLIPQENTWMGIYYDKEILHAVYPLVSIRYVDSDGGFRVFTKQRIPSCSFVGEYTGQILESKSKHLKDKSFCFRYNVWEMKSKKYIIDANNIGNFTRFINHSSSPNLSLQSVYWRGLPRLIFIAVKEIEEGAQLTFDFGTFFGKEWQIIPRPV